MEVAIVVALALALLAGSVIYSKKNHNLVEEVASEIIEKETGVDIDKLLPPDK